MTRAHRPWPKLYLVKPSEPPTTRDLPDPYVQRAIALMDADLSVDWTVQKLARKVGLSRPALSRRFVASTGSPPLRFLTERRMQRAAEWLEHSDHKLADVAARVGYASEFAFNRAFKRVYRVAPGSFRRQLRTSAPVFRAAA